jgi:hypothetical protein
VKARKTTKLVHEGRYAAEVEVELIEGVHDWVPYLSIEDVRKVEAVRRALQTRDLAAAAKLAKVYELKPVAAE